MLAQTTSYSYDNEKTISNVTARVKIILLHGVQQLNADKKQVIWDWENRNESNFVVDKSDQVANTPVVRSMFIPVFRQHKLQIEKAKPD